MIHDTIKLFYGGLVLLFLFWACLELDCCRMSLKRNDDATVLHIYPGRGEMPEVLR